MTSVRPPSSAGAGPRATSASCAQEDAKFSSFRRGRLPYRRWSGCRLQFNVIAGSVFDAAKLPLTVWFLAMHLLIQAKTNMSMLELSRRLGHFLTFGLADEAQAD